MCAKWSVLKGKVEAFQLNPSFQEKVNEAKKAYIGLESAELARQLAIEDRAKEICEEVISMRNVEIEAISQLFVEAMEGSSVEKITLDSGMSCSVDVTPYIGVADTPEAREAYDRWVHSKNIKPLLTLNAKTRDVFVKEELMLNFSQGKPIAKPIAAWVKVFLKTRAKLYGRKKENSKEEE